MKTAISSKTKNPVVPAEASHPSFGRQSGRLADLVNGSPFVQDQFKRAGAMQNSQPVQRLVNLAGVANQTVNDFGQGHT